MPPFSLVSSVRVPCGTRPTEAWASCPDPPRASQGPLTSLDAWCPPSAPYLSWLQLGDVPHYQALHEPDAVPAVHQGLQGAGGLVRRCGYPPAPAPSPRPRYLQHVGDVEEGAVAAGVQV